MKASYRIGVKQLCRQRLRSFIAERFSDNKIRNARVLCFAGREALEVFEIYEDLGVALENVVCLEQYRKFYNELVRRNQGFDIRLQTLDEFIASPGQDRFDIVSLDFTGQLGTYENSIYRLAKQGLLQDDVIVFTNFCGAREADATKGYYLAAELMHETPLNISDIVSVMRRYRRSPEKAARALERKVASRPNANLNVLKKTLPDRRSDAIHELVRTALQGGSPGMVDILFREWDRDGSLSRHVESYWNEVGEAPEDDPALAAMMKNLRTAMRKKDDALPPFLAHDLSEGVTAQVRACVRKFAKQSKRFRINVPLITRILTIAIEQCLRRPYCVQATQSYKYISDRGTPMYADLYHLRRIHEFDFLSEWIHPAASSLEELLEPVRRLSLDQFLTLVETLRRTGERVAELERAGPGTPPRIILGRESELNPRKEPQKLDRKAMKAQALLQLLQSPELTIEDIALKVGAKPMQVAAWKAHITMGTYSPATKDHLIHLADREYTAGHFPEALQLTERLLKQQPNNARLLNNKATIVSCMGREQQALRIVDRALSLHPRNPLLLVNRAGQLLDLGRLSEADTAFQVAASAVPKNPNVLVSWGHVLRRLGRHEEADLKYEAALVLNPALFEAKRCKAVNLSEQGKLEAALQEFDLLIEKHPQEPEAYYDRSVVLAHAGKIDRSIADLRTVLTLAPGNFQALYNLGTALLERNKDEEAHEFLLRAVQIQPTNTSALNNLAIVCARLKKYRDATDLFSQILKLEPQCQSARAGRSRTLRSAGLLYESLADCEQLVEQSPESSEYWNARGHVLFELNRKAQALDSFERAIQLDEHNIEALFATAIVFSSEHKYTDALRLFDSLRKRFPEDVPILLGRADVLASAGRAEEALAGFEEVLQMDPENASALGSMASALSRLGRLQESLRHFDKSIRLDSSDYDTTYNKATTLAKLQKFEEAVSAYDACIEMHPHDNESYCNRGACKMKLGDLKGAMLDFNMAVNLNHKDEAAWDNLRKIERLCADVPGDAEDSRTRGIK
jgi:tetratricopeptide (TPR) repeat protein